MGMSWTEVHDEAEHSSTPSPIGLIERIDEMLGTARGRSARRSDSRCRGHGGTADLRDAADLPAQPAGAVSRVSDQDREFLRFIERHDLKPGAIVEVEERDAAADSVRLKGAREFTIGARAASKVLVAGGQRSAAPVALAPRGRSATTPRPPAARAEPFEITDNSFLVEEAFNQEAGIFQNIFNAARSRTRAGRRRSPRNGRSPRRRTSSRTRSPGYGGQARRFGDALINYRYQAMMEGPGRPAFSPRLSLILPTGQRHRRRRDRPGCSSTCRSASRPATSTGTGTPADLAAGGGTSRTAARKPRHRRSSPAARSIACTRCSTLMLENRLLDYEEHRRPWDRPRATVHAVTRCARRMEHRRSPADPRRAVPITWAGGPARDRGLLYVSYELPFKKLVAVPGQA